MDLQDSYVTYFMENTDIPNTNFGDKGDCNSSKSRIGSLPNIRSNGNNQSADTSRKSCQSPDFASISHSALPTTFARSRSLGYFTESGFSTPSSNQITATNLKNGCNVFTLGGAPIYASEKLQIRSSKYRSKNYQRSLTSVTSSHFTTASAIGGTSSPGLSVRSATINDRTAHYQTDETIDDVKPCYTSHHDMAGDTCTRPYKHCDLYAKLASNTASVAPFSKSAYPDLYGSSSYPVVESLHKKKTGIQRELVFEDIDRNVHCDDIINIVAYDLDELIASTPFNENSYSNLCNRDAQRLSMKECNHKRLMFNSQFESGNLRKAIQIREYEYDLILSPDVNTNHHHQWFYFEVSNMTESMSYRFNIVNCEKANSQYNYGMKPLLFSVVDSISGKPFWRRVGSNICYYKNHFKRANDENLKNKTYYTTSFRLTFPRANDICYIAYHYPYTYTTLQMHLYEWERDAASDIYWRRDNLCDTLAGNAVPVLTITSQPANQKQADSFVSKPYIFLTSRVHPGESNASWVMKGTIDYLMSDEAAAVRDSFVFKIIPMLNPDGVINGNHRCSLVGHDLNRCWMSPQSHLHPTIFHAKGLLQYMNRTGKTPLVRSSVIIKY